MAPKKTPSSYTALARIRHGADRYEIGSTIDLTPSEAEHLLAAGSIVPAGTAAPAKEEE